MGNSYAFNPNMNGFYFGWNTNFSTPSIGGWGNKSSSGNSSAKSEFELELERQQKESELILKNQDKIKQYEEALQAKIDFASQMSETLEKAEKGKVDEATGQIMVKETKAEFKKLSKWQKFKRSLIKMGEGALDCGMDMLGIESVIPPKINAKKALKAVAGIALVAAATVIPGVGPFVVPALLTAGVLAGGTKVGTGIYKACTTDNPEEFDNACKSAGEGATILGLSVAGVRKAGGLTGMFKNAATKAVAEFKAPMKAFKANINSAKQSVKDIFSSRVKDKAFNQSFKNNAEGIKKQITEIDARINTAGISDAEKAILEQEKIILEAQKNQIHMTHSKSEWEAIKSESTSKSELQKLTELQKDLAKGKKVKIGDFELEPTVENKALLEGLVKRNKKLSTELAELAKLKQKVMKQTAFLKLESNQITKRMEAYTGETSRIKQAYQIFKPNTKFTWKGAVKAPFKAIGKYLKISFIPYTKYINLAKKGYTPIYTAEKTFNPKYESEGAITGLVTMASGLVGAKMTRWIGGDTPLTTTITTPDENGQEVTQEVAVTQETLAELENQKKAAEQEIDKIRNEITKLKNPDICIA